MNCCSTDKYGIMMEENKNMEMACAVIVILGLFTVCAVTAIIQKFVEYKNNRADRG